MENNGLKVLFPAPVMYSALGVLGVWVVGVYFVERLENWFVTIGLLVSSAKPHFITLPMTETGMSVRTMIALLGVILFVGGIAYFITHIGRADADQREAPPPPARESMAPDPMMDLGGPDMFGMPPMGGGFGGPPPVGGIGTGVPPGF